MSESSRFKHEPCERCGWKYGFHICVDLTAPEPVRLRKKTKRDKLQYLGDEHMLQLHDARDQKWAKYNDANKTRDAEIVKKYEAGGTSFAKLSKEYGPHRNTIRRIVMRARGEQI